MRLEKLRDLHFSASSGGGWLSAASGLVRYGNRLYVIADDALHLGVFEADRPGSKRRLITGTLPDEPKARKRAKPDFEALTHLPAGGGMPFGGMLAMGSGSTDNRRRGVLIPFTATGLSRRTIGIDMTLLHEGLSAMIQDPTSKAQHKGAMICCCFTEAIATVPTIWSCRLIWLTCSTM